MAEEYNGWKNQATWSVVCLHMEAIVGSIEDGWHEEEIKGLILSQCRPENMTTAGRDLFMSAWSTIDWFTILKNANEIIENGIARRSKK
jgi:hypothetical protein